MPTENTTVDNVVSNNQENNNMANEVALSQELKNRLKVARSNGDAIAVSILDTLKQNKGVLNGKVYSSKKVVNRGRVVGIKIIENAGQAEAETMVAQEFARRVLPEDSPLRTQEALDSFNEAIKITNKMKASIGQGFKVLRYAYYNNNYCDESTIEASLTKSFINNFTYATMYANFYSKIAPCRIIMVKNKDKKIMARALVWDHVTFEGQTGQSITASLLGRIYYNSIVARDYLQRYAKKLGITVCLSTQESSSSFEILNEPANQEDKEKLNSILGNYFCRALTRIQLRNTYKGGSPFVDTFKYMTYENGGLYLVSRLKSSQEAVGFMQNTDGRMSLRTTICPICGSYPVTVTDHPFCNSCKSKLNAVNTLFGDVIQMKTKYVKNWGSVPVECLENGKLKDSAITAIMLSRLSMNPPSIEVNTEQVAQ